MARGVFRFVTVVGIKSPFCELRLPPVGGTGPGGLCRRPECRSRHRLSDRRDGVTTRRRGRVPKGFLSTRGPNRATGY